MALEALSFLGLFAITIVIGYIGSLIFKRTGVSDVIWLLLLGLILGPVLGWIDRAVFIAVLPLLSALALILILFDAGLNMDFYQVVRNFSRSLLLSIVCVIVSAVAVALFVFYFLNFGILQSLLVGFIISGTSSASVASIVGRIKGIREDVKTVLTLESILNDPITIVVPIVLIGLMAGGTEISAISPIAGIVSAFSIGGMVGLIGGVIWLLIGDRLKEKHLEYMLTLAALFVIYVIVESSGGSGAIAALLFGLVLGNKRTFYKMLKVREKSRDEYEGVRATQFEISFFIRSFFFVYLGLIAAVSSLQFIVYGIAILGIIILARLLSTEIATYKMVLRGNEKNIIRAMGPRGLAAAVMSQLPLSMGLPYGNEILSIGFIVILGTTLYTTIMGFVFRKHSKQGSHKVHRKKQVKNIDLENGANSTPVENK